MASGPAPWLGQDLAWLGVASSAYRDRTAPARSSVAFVIDLPGGKAIEMALALADAGLRPVLAINATSAEHEVIDMDPIVSWLETGARFRSTFAATTDAAPVFILDSRRLGRGGRAFPGWFDNRWTLFASDLPSAKQLKASGIERVVLVQEHTSVNEDLLAIGWAYERAGLPVRVADAEEKQIVGLPGERQGIIQFVFGQLTRRLTVTRRWDGSFGHRAPRESSHG
jgi:hypothetical protein